MTYSRFFAMIVTSTLVMFILMYLNTYVLAHVFFSETRTYMAILMGATMAIIMLAFMLSMYSSKTINAAIFVCAAVVFAGSLWLVRSQVTVQDNSFMRAMIPHHSIAIMTSSRAEITDPRVRKLADEIVYAQDKEIAEMRYLIADIEANGGGTEEGEASAPQIVSLDAALSSAKIAAIDPEFLTDADRDLLFPQGTQCTFTYTENSPPVLATGPGDGATAALIKLSGDLLQLDPGASLDGGADATLTTQGLTARLSDPDGAALASPSDGAKPT